MLSVIISLSFSVMKHSKLSLADTSGSPEISCARDEASTTVGTPMEITGIPIFSRVSAMRELFTPEPGCIPLSDSCIMQARCESFLEASASMAIRQSGLMSSIILLIISPLSIPVCDSTPGASAATSLSDKSRYIAGQIDFM